MHLVEYHVLDEFNISVHTPGNNAIANLCPEISIRSKKQENGCSVIKIHTAHVHCIHSLN